MATTPTYINQRINNLQAQVNSIISGGGGGVPTSSNLADVLDNGNSAGAFDVNMNSKDILAVDNINAVTINSSLGALTLPSPVAFTNAIAPTCNANPLNPLELCNKQYVDSQSVLTAYQLYFNYSVPYTVPSGSTYSTLSQTQVVSPQTIAWSTSSTSPVFLAGFFNLLTNLNITSIPAGVWTLLAFANLTSAAGQGREAFFYTIVGTASTGAETVLYTSPASLLLNTVTPLIGSISVQGTIPAISLVGYTGLGIKLFIQANTALLTTGSVFYQTLNSYSSILTSILPITAISTLNQVLNAGNTATGTTAKIILNNTGVGGTANPLVSLNLTTAVGTGILVEEMYNQRNPVTGEFNRMSFFAKSSTGTKIEYGRIHQNAVVTALGSTRGRMDFAVDVGGTMTDFLTLNASSNVVNCLRSLNMNSLSINQAPDIFTPNGNPYGKIDVQYLNTPTANFPTNTPDSNIRATLFNQGLTPTIDPLVGNFPSTWGAITASAIFGGYTYVGTDNGLIYYSSDGATWFQVNVDFDGIIRGLKEFNGYLYIVGEFNAETVSALACNGIAKIDSSNNFYQITWTNVGGNGFNAKVKCLETSASGYLYIGGDFSNTNLGSLSMNYIAIVDTVDNLYCMDNSSGTGYGFDNPVYFIKENASAPNVLIIGGDFSNVSTSLGNFSVSRNAIWTTNGSYDTSVAPYQVVAFNATPRCITSNGASNYIGGDFTGLTYGDYLVSFDWDGANYIEATFPTSLGTSGSPVNLILQDGGVWFTNTSLELYQNGVLIGTSPTGGDWSAIIAGIWGQKAFSTISSSQDPVVAYFINSATLIQVTLVGGYSIKNAGVTYTGGFNISSNGASLDMIYNVAESAYYVVSINNGSVVFF